MATAKRVIPLNRSIYLLPNLLTTTTLCAGFFAIVASMQKHFVMAVLASILAMISDGLDGRIARITGTQTPFGQEFDSLADMVAFGVAPAILMYCWFLNQLGKIGWAVAFVYVAATALRLARFNVQAKSAQLAKNFSKGLTCTMAAGVMVSFVWLVIHYNLTGWTHYYMPAWLTLSCAVLMVSHMGYHTFKASGKPHRLSFFSAFVIVVAFFVVFLDPPLVMFVILAAYALSGPIFHVARMLGWGGRHLKKMVSKNKKARS